MTPIYSIYLYIFKYFEASCKNKIKNISKNQVRHSPADVIPDEWASPHAIYEISLLTREEI